MKDHIKVKAEAAAAAAGEAAHKLEDIKDKAKTASVGMSDAYEAVVDAASGVSASLTEMGVGVPHFEMGEFTCTEEGICSGSFALGPTGCGDKCKHYVESQIGAKGAGFSTQLVLKLDVDGSPLFDKSMGIAKWGGSSVKARESAVAKEHLDPMCVPVPTLLIGNGKVCFKASDLVFSSRGLSVDYSFSIVLPLLEFPFNIISDSLVLPNSNSGENSNTQVLPCGAHRSPSECMVDEGCGWCSTGKGLCLPLLEEGGGERLDQLGLCSPCGFFSALKESGNVGSLADACLAKPGCGLCTHGGRDECHAGDHAGFRGSWQECGGQWRPPR